MQIPEGVGDAGVGAGVHVEGKVHVGDPHLLDDRQAGLPGVDAGNRDREAAPQRCEVGLLLALADRDVLDRAIMQRHMGDQRNLRTLVVAERHVAVPQLRLLGLRVELRPSVEVNLGEVAVLAKLEVLDAALAITHRDQDALHVRDREDAVLVEVEARNTE